MIRVLFICMGNICRSPMAEAVMKHLVEQEGLARQITVDSVGIDGWHVGEPRHPGSQAVLRGHGIPFAGSARQITLGDIARADYLVCMDRENVAGVRYLDRSPSVETKLHRLLEFAPSGLPEDVPDPYYHGNFDEVFRLVDAGCQGLLAHIRAEHNV